HPLSWQWGPGANLTPTRSLLLRTTRTPTQNRFRLDRLRGNDKRPPLSLELDHQRLRHQNGARGRRRGHSDPLSHYAAGVAPVRRTNLLSSAMKPTWISARTENMLSCHPAFWRTPELLYTG